MKSKDKKTVGYTENTKYRCLEDHQQVNSMSIVSPLNLDYCGIEQCEPGHTFGPYARENYVVHIIMKGCGVLQMGKKEFRMSAGEGRGGLSGGRNGTLGIYVGRVSWPCG